jgi:hypothetical protein
MPLSIKETSSPAVNARSAHVRSRRSQAIAHVDAESLEEYQMDIAGTAANYDRNYVPRGFQLDSALAIGQNSFVSTYPSSLSGFPISTTRNSLYLNMLSLLQRGRPPPSLSQLIHYYAIQDRWLRSARSYGLLIELAIQRASFKTVRDLLTRMRADGIVADAQTQVLVIRWLVRTGRWEKAWRQVSEDLRKRRSSPLLGTSEDRTLLRQWLELFGTEKQRAFAYSHQPSPVPVQPVESPTDPNPLSEEDTARQQLREKHELLLRRAPHSAGVASQRQNAWMVFTLAEAFLRAGDTISATHITRDYLRSLPSTVDERWRQRCVRIINLHAAGLGNSGKGLERHMEIRKAVTELVSLSPSVVPTSTTLFLLLSSLRKCRRPFARGQRLVDQFVRRWGNSVVDDRVERRLSSFAVKENMLGRASAIINRVAAMWRRRSQRQKLENVADYSSETAPLGRGRYGRPLSLRLRKEILYRRGRSQEVVRWRFLRRRLRRSVWKRRKALGLGLARPGTQSK